MEILIIDVLDGNGLIPVAVCNAVQAIRLDKFARDARRAFPLVSELNEKTLYELAKPCWSFDHLSFDHVSFARSVLHVVGADNHEL